MICQYFTRGVEPVFLAKDQTIKYAQQRAGFRLFDLDFRRDLWVHQ
jgi:hypothetical protein